MENFMQEKVINSLTLLRFPLIILVVMIHARSELTSFVDFSSYGSFANSITIYISHIIAGSAVPCFFAISGYMYFYNVKIFDKDIFLKKCKRRVYSLLIPYISWNLIVMFVYLVGHYLTPSMMNGGTVDFKNFGIYEFLNFFWKGNSGKPLCYQMWFIRDLICVCFFTPLIYWLVKRLKFVFPFILICCWLVDLFKDFNLDAITFFSLGAFLSITSVNLKFSKKVCLLFIGCYVILSLLMLTQSRFTLYALRFHLICGVVAFYMIAYQCVKYEFPNFLTKSTFFVFALHGLVLMIIVRVMKKVLIINSDLTLVTSYFINPIMTVLICLGIFYVFDKISWFKFLSGGR